jgi:hypothetical protein
MQPVMYRMLTTHAPAATLLVRVLVGGVFLTEGILKFILPGELGAGRFTHIGIPAPEVMGPFVGVVEIAAGLLLLFGLLTRPAAFALLIRSADRHFRRHYLDQSAHSLGTWVLDVRPAQAATLWVLGHGPRGADGFLHVVGVLVSDHGRCGAALVGRPRLRKESVGRRRKTRTARQLIPMSKFAARSRKPKQARRGNGGRIPISSQNPRESKPQPTRF